MAQFNTGPLRTAACLYSRRKQTTAFVYQRPDGRSDWTAADLIREPIKGEITHVYKNGELIQSPEGKVA